MDNPFGSNPKIAFVCRGGPENGPYSAVVCRILNQKLNQMGLSASAIYASSGSVPTALLGCVNEFDRLCETWRNVTPEKIVGKVTKARTIYRILRKESILSSEYLKKLITDNWELDRIFSPEAIRIKFPAVDLVSTEYIIFTNKNPKHRQWFAEGALGSMALAPFLQPQFVYNPVEAELIDPSKARNNALVLIDGGFKGNILLEEAIRDGYNVIFLVDIHGLKTTETDLTMRYHWSSLIRSGLHILSHANDNRQYQIADRINEEIEIKEAIKELIPLMPPEQAEVLKDIIGRMNNGRLRLGDKDRIKIITVSNENHSILFNFAKFEKETLTQLMNAGEEAAKATIKELKLD